MKILVSGASGFVGSALKERLSRGGAQVVSLVRRPPVDPRTELQWNPAAGRLDPSALSGCDAIINLNGRSISQGRWSPKVKDELRSSRLDATRTIVEAIELTGEPPPLLINASATGFYGDRGDEMLDEDSEMGDGFLAELCRDWETAALEARSDTTRVVMLRLGMVLGDGAALEKMLPPFKLGFGGPMGSGMSDVLGAVDHVLDNPKIEGPVNLVAPEEATSRSFARTLGGQLGRPAVVPAPAFAVKLALGEMAEALLLSSTRVKPTVLEKTGYEFKAPTLAVALRQILD
jgi:uncharacterized protein (TIGR01777 family)